MSRLTSLLSRANAAGRCGLICFLEAGDPSAEATTDLACTVAEAGADIVELGIPFSDPVADGPTIQASAMRALAAHTSVRDVLECARQIRKRSDVGLVAMTYANPIFQYGFGRFGVDAREAGIDGIIVTDLPAEEADDWIGVARQSGLDTVFLVTPTSTPERLQQAARVSTGFLYCVSRMGVTGAQSDLSSDAAQLVGRARAVAQCPVCVGFGISRPEHVGALAGIADGVIVGSALVAAVQCASDQATRLRNASELVRALHTATYRTAGAS